MDSPEAGDGFLPGSVVEVEMADFMTYRHALACPGPRLNLILGPNGSGKSSLVAALCLGLGGGTQLLGRASTPGAYVRHGAASGHVRVVLRGHGPRGGDTVVRRTLQRQSNESIWELDGRRSTKREVRERVRQAGVQLDNLCQFLPQDKVSSFASMDGRALLRATQRATGRPHLELAFAELAELAEGERKAANEARALENAVRQLGEKVEAFEPTLRLAEARAAAREETAAAGSLADLAALRDLSERASAAARDRDTVSARLREEEREARGAVNALARLEARERELRTARASAEVALERTHFSLVGGRGESGLLGLLSEARRAADSAVIAIGDYDAQIRGRLRQLEADRAGLSVLEVKQSEGEEVERERVREAKQDLIRAQAQVKEASTAHEEAKLELADARETMEGVRRRAARLADGVRRAESARYRAAVRLGPHGGRTAQAAVWLASDEARRLFSGAVMGPAVCDVRPRDARAAALLETHLGPTALSLFACEDRGDASRLDGELRSRFNLRANIAFVGAGQIGGGERNGPGAPAGAAAPTTPAALAALGIVETLADVFEAPPLIKRVLMNEGGLSSAYIASEAVPAAQCFERAPFVRILYHGDLVHRRVVSRYHQGAHSFSIEPVREARVFETAARGDTRGSDVGVDGGTSYTKSEGPEVSVAAAVEREASELGVQIELLEERVRQRRRELEQARDAEDRANGLRVELEREQRAQALALLKLRKAVRQNEADTERKTVAAKRESLEGEAAKARRDAAKAAGRAVASAGTVSAALRSLAAAELALEEASARRARKSELGESRHGDLRRIRAELRDAQHRAATLGGRRDSALRTLQERWGGRLPRSLAARAPGGEREAGVASPLEGAAAGAASSPHGLIPAAELASVLEQLDLPATSEAVEAAERAQARLDAAPPADPRMLREHAELSDALREARGRFDAVRDRRDGVRARMESLRETWVGEVREMVRLIDSNFRRSFPSVGIAGEVVLREPEPEAAPSERGGAPREGRASSPPPPPSMDAYSIEICVKFRQNVPMAPLDGLTQSGGERSVSTVLYLIALQGIAHVPFRLVDEINQGMDPVNERRVYGLLVRQAARPSSPQCFLLTPKLLPGVSLGMNVRVLQVMNGPRVITSATERGTGWVLPRWPREEGTGERPGGGGHQGGPPRGGTPGGRAGASPPARLGEPVAADGCPATPADGRRGAPADSPGQRENRGDGNDAGPRRVPGSPPAKRSRAGEEGAPRRGGPRLAAAA